MHPALPLPVPADTAPPGLQLDARQRAMLQEMGIAVWAPKAAAAPALARNPIAIKNRANNVTNTLAYGPFEKKTPVADRSGMAPAAAAPLAGVASMDWPALHGAVAACRACGLCQGRQHSVPGAGSRSARWLVLGDAPGEQDDAQGQPFAGPPGQLLGNMLRSAGLERADTAAGAPEAAAGHAVYLTHLVKCRPPGNRPPSAAEVAQCAPYLQRQIALVQPRVIVALGKLAAQALLQHSVPGVAQAPLGKLRGQVYQIANPETGQPIAVVVSYDPATLLRNLPEKAKAWADWCLALQTQQEPPSA